MKEIKTSIKRNWRSYRYAFKGLGYLLRENNFNIELVAGIVTILLGIFLEISGTEWIVITLCIGMVLSAEAFNTAIEHLIDLHYPEFNQKAGRIKDLSAAAVLITALAALITGLIIFIPKFY